MDISNTTKEYHSSNHCKYSCQYHVIFCPKYRRKVLIDGVDERFKTLVKSKESDYNYEVIEMEVMPDHVHLLLDMSPDSAINQVIGKIKGYTSHVLREEFPWLKKRIPSL